VSEDKLKGGKRKEKKRKKKNLPSVKHRERERDLNKLHFASYCSLKFTQHMTEETVGDNLLRTKYQRGTLGGRNLLL